MPPKCITYPSVTHNHAYSFSVSHIQVYHTSKRLTYSCLFIQCVMPSKCLAHSSVSHNHAYLFSVSCPPSAPHIRVPIHSSVSHIQVPIHPVSRVSKCILIQCYLSKCLTYPSAYSFSVPHIQVPIHSACHTSKRLFVHCLTYQSTGCLSVRVYSISKCLTYPSAYSFSVLHLQAPIRSLFHISKCWASKCQSV